MFDMAIRRIVIVTKRPYEAAKELSKHFEVGDKGDICVALSLIHI